jgi:glycogen debranching enzyme
VPSLARNSGGFYEDGGDYWRGGVWCITNLMVVKGLVSKGYGKLAHEISHKHVTMVAEVFMKTGSIWESYDALKAQPGKLAGKFVRNEFVGFSGVGPITMLIEEVIGLKPDVARNSLIWDINLTEGHGIQRYSFGVDGKIDLYCHPRKDRMSEPVIDAVSNKSISLIIRWENSEKTIIIPKGGENK